MKNNHPIPHNRFKKTAIRYRTPFHLPAQRIIRANKRTKTAKRIYPMPTSKLHPIVRCPTLRHNKRERLGRGFTPEEIRDAGFNYKDAVMCGVKVDYRRRNHNQESFNQNVERVRVYMSRLTFFNNRKEAKESGHEQFCGVIMPIMRKKKGIDVVRISEIDSKVWAADKVKELIEEVKYKREEIKGKKK